VPDTRAISQDNIEIVRAVMDAFNRRDVEGLEALLAPDVEIVPLRAAVESNSAYRGPTAAADWYAAVEEAWVNLMGEFEGAREVGDRVLVFGRIRGRGRGSGAALDVEAAGVAHFRAGLITRLQIFTNREEALQAAGLAE
jgi:ketosteroid isomerase-like protein